MDVACARRDSIGTFPKISSARARSSTAINGGLEFSFDGRAVSFSSYKF